MARGHTPYLRGFFGSLFAALALMAGGAAHAQQAWRPDKATEIIVTTSPGGSNDFVARLVQQVLQDGKLLPTPVVVLNKPGGNQTLAVSYLNQHSGDAHYMLMGNPTVITNPLNGITQVTRADMTPIANLLVEHTAITVRADSPIRNLRDLAERLKADPESMVVGSAARGGVNHLALAIALKAGGVDPKRVKMVVFKTNGESIAAMMGGHIHLVTSSVNAARPQVAAGSIRAIAVAALRRMSGPYAETATFPEQGIENWVSSWRGMFAPKGTSAAQVAYWEDLFARMAANEEWTSGLVKREWQPHFLRTKEFVQYLDAQHNAARTTMAELGLIKWIVSKNHGRALARVVCQAHEIARVLRCESSDSRRLFSW
jgi:putative tricarboxylic transport membrane protein